MTTRTAANVPARNARAGIAKAAKAKGFTKAPSAVKGKGSGPSSYESGDLLAARSGPLSDKMEAVFGRDTQLDPGVEVEAIAIEGEQSERVSAFEDYEAESRRLARSAEVRREAERQGLNVLVTANGAVQYRHTKESGGRPGTVAKQVRAPFKGDAGQFVTPTRTEFVEVTVVKDPQAFKEAAERRVEGYGSSLFGDRFTEPRRQAMLSGLERDRRRRGWAGVPDL